MKKSIIEKGKETVTRAESSARQGSLGGFVKRGLPMTLAVLMLTSMLASCDEFTFGGVETGTEEVYLENFEPEEYGLVGPFANEWNIASALDKEGEDFTYLTESIDLFAEEFPRPKDLNFSTKRSMAVKVFGYWTIARDDELRKNVVLPLDNVSGGKSLWSHSIVSTSDDFVLMTTDWKGKKYFTGLVNGTFRNDVGFIDRESAALIKSKIKSEGYDEVVKILRRSVFGALAQDSLRTDLPYVMWYESKWQFDEQLMNSIATFKSIEITDPQENELIKIVPQYDIAENYLDKWVGKNNSNHHQGGDKDDHQGGNQGGR